MLRDQLVPSDVDQQILLLEMLADTAGDTAQQTHSGRGDRGLGDEHAGVEVVLVDNMVEGAHLLGTDTGRVGAEFNVDGSAVRLGVRVRVGLEGRVFEVHGLRGASLDFHLVPAAQKLRRIVSGLFSWEVENVHVVWGRILWVSKGIGVFLSEFFERYLHFLFGDFVALSENGLSAYIGQRCGCRQSFPSFSSTYPILKHFEHRPPCAPKSGHLAVGIDGARRVVLVHGEK